MLILKAALRNNCTIFSFSSIECVREKKGAGGSILACQPLS